jgi:hypothetical protein
MKPWSRIGKLIGRLIDRQGGNPSPDRVSGSSLGGMNRQPIVRWLDDSAAIIGSPRNVQEKLAKYQTGGWGQQATGRGRDSLTRR